MNYIVIENEYEWIVTSLENYKRRISNAREYLHFRKTEFSTINEVRAYCREYLSIEGIMEVK